MLFMTFHMINVCNYCLRLKCSGALVPYLAVRGPRSPIDQGRKRVPVSDRKEENQLPVHFISHRIKHKVMYHKQ